MLHFLFIFLLWGNDPYKIRNFQKNIYQHVSNKSTCHIYYSVNRFFYRWSHLDADHSILHIKVQALGDVRKVVRVIEFLFSFLSQWCINILYFPLNTCIQ